MGSVIAEIGQRLLAAHRLLIVAHIRPDGDAIGSLLALGLALQDKGKSVQMVIPDGVPATFKHLPGSDQVVTKPTGDFDLIITVDCSDLTRAGNALDGYRKPDIVIDHHITNDNFGTLNLVDPKAAATASVLLQNMEAWELAITPQIAANLLTGLITDTLGFRTSNTTPEALHQAARLMQAGADMHELYYRGLVRRSLPAARYWGAGLSSLKHAEGVVWVTLTLEDRRTSGYNGNDDADLINIISAIDDSDVSIIFNEQPTGMVKVAWRANNPHIDVARIAQQFGGGGHQAAAGAELEGSMEEVQQRVLMTTQKAIHDESENK